MTFKVAPLNSTFMLISILGFLISVMLVKDISWKVAFGLVFALMFIASILSTTYGNPDLEMDMDKPKKRKAKKK